MIPVAEAARRSVCRGFPIRFVLGSQRWVGACGGGIIGPFVAYSLSCRGVKAIVIERLRARGDIAIVMIAHNYAQTLEICDRVVLMQHGEITFESQAAATPAEELLEIVRCEYRAARTG